MKFSFWARASRLVAVTGCFSIMLTVTALRIFRYTGATARRPQARTQLTVHFAHLLLPHHRYYIQERKEILFFLFQSSCCHREAENQQQSDYKFKENQFLAVLQPKHRWYRRKFQLVVDTQEPKSPQPRPFGCQMFQNNLLNTVMTLNIPHVLSA